MTLLQEKRNAWKNFNKKNQRMIARIDNTTTQQPKE